MERASQRPRRSDRHGAGATLLLLHQDAALHIGADRGHARRGFSEGEAAGTRRGPHARRGRRTERAQPPRRRVKPPTPAGEAPREIWMDINKELERRGERT
jgi:hypothetical protein